jgi:hypothetical protein
VRTSVDGPALLGSGNGLPVPSVMTFMTTLPPTHSMLHGNVAVDHQTTATWSELSPDRGQSGKAM